MKLTLIALLFSMAFLACGQTERTSNHRKEMGSIMKDGKVVKSTEEWRAQLTDEEFDVLRNKGTEMAFSGKYWNEKANGTYHCAGCNYPLFSSDSKFKSGTGWPSFFESVNDSCIATHTDRTYGMVRTEITCSRCDGHLGHVFNDGPQPTGLRYCVNSVSLKLVENK